MSESNVKVTITGDTSAAEDALKRVTISAADFAKSLQAAGGDLRKVKMDLDNTATATKAVAVEAKAATQAYQPWGNALRSAAESAEVFRKALGDQTNEVKALRDAMREQVPATEAVSTATQAATGHMDKFGGMTNRAKSEIIVIAHEMVQGRFSRVPGSLMVLAESMGGVSMATWGAVAAVGALGYAFYEIIAHARQANLAMAGAFNAAVLQGRLGIEVEASAKKWTAEIKNASTLSASEAREIAVAIAKIPRLADDTRESLVKLGPALMKALGADDTEKFAAKISKIFASTSGINAFVEENNLLEGEQKKQFDAAVRAGEGYKVQALALEGLQGRIGPAAAQMREAIRLQNAAAVATKGMPSAILETDPTKLKAQAIVPRLTQGTVSGSEADREAAARQEEYLQGLREREKLESDEIVIRANLAKATTQGAHEEAAEALKVNLAMQAGLKDRGDTSWLQKQELALQRVTAAAGAGSKTRQQLTEAELAATVTFWHQAAAVAGISEQQKTEAQLRAGRAEDALRKAKITDASANARKGTEEQVAELSAQQAANHDNFTRWKELEAEKLSILRNAYGEKSAQFQRELKAQETYEIQHRNRVQQEELLHLNRLDQLGQQAIADKKAELAIEVESHRMTKSEELTILRGFAAAEYQIEKDRLTTFMETMNKETEAYRKAKDQQALLAGKAARTDKEYQAQRIAADNASTRDMYRNFSGISSASTQAVAGMIKGTMSWQRAEQQVAGAVLDSFINMGARMLLEWVGLEDGKTLATVSGWVARLFADTAGEGAGVVSAKVAAVAEITAYAAVAGSAAYAAIAGIPVVGPGLAPAAAASAYEGAISFVSLAAVPSFDVGSWDIPANTLAMVHQGEMIIPAAQAAQVRSGGGGFPSGVGGGGGDVHLHVSALDAGSVTALFRSQGADLARIVAHQMSNNPSLRPRY